MSTVDSARREARPDMLVLPAAPVASPERTLRGHLHFSATGPFSCVAEAIHFTAAHVVPGS
jgi:hypothetical protein